MNSKYPVFLAAIIAVLAAVSEIPDHDWMLLLIEAAFIGVGALCLRKGMTPTKGIYLPMAGSLVILVFSVLDSTGALDSYSWDGIRLSEFIDSIFVPAISTYVGLMFATLINCRNDSKITPRWICIFAVVFGLAYAAFYIFTIGFHIWYTGQPFFNYEDIYWNNKYTSRILMLPCLGSVLTVPVYGLILRRCMGPIGSLVHGVPPRTEPCAEWTLWSRFALVIGIVFALAMAVVAFIGYFLEGSEKYELYTGLACAAMAMMPYILARYGIIHMPVWLSFIVELALFFHAFGVMMFSYDFLKYYDTFTHTLSSFVTFQFVMIALLCLGYYGKDRFAIPFVVILTILVMMSFGNYWESFEYVMDVTNGLHMQYSPFDTFRDMIANSFGAILGTAFAMWIYRGKDREDIVSQFGIHPYMVALLKG